MVNFDDYKNISNNIYNSSLTEGLSSDWQVINISSMGYIPNGNNYVVHDPSNGFNAAAYYNSSTHELVIVYRGSENYGDFISDAWIIAGQIPPQASDAYQFYNAAAYYVTQILGDTSAQISLTGHSLGGALAQVIASNNNLAATTFNAPGMAYCAGQHTSQINNYVIMNDYVGNLRSHAGDTYYIAPVAITSNPLTDTHNSILQYTKSQFGDIFSHPEGFGTSEALSLWYYDVKNNNIGVKQALST